MMVQLCLCLWWSGFDVVFLVDDWYMIVGVVGGMLLMVLLVLLLLVVVDIGLYIIVICQMSQVYKVIMDKFVGVVFGLGVLIMFFLGEKQEFLFSEFKVKWCFFGQVFFVLLDGKEVIQVFYIEFLEEVFVVFLSVG